nr:transposase [Carnobacterium iners]
MKNVFIGCGKTDMCRQIDGLVATIVEEYDMNIYEDAVFLFCGSLEVGPHGAACQENVTDLGKQFIATFVYDAIRIY